MRTSNSLRIASLAAVLLAGSCTAPNGIEPEPKVFADGVVNHPIAVEPGYRTLKVDYAGAGLSPEDSVRLSGFVSDYMSHGNGMLTVSAPRGPDSSREVEYFAAELQMMGVPRARLLVGTRDTTDSGARVELGYVSYAAHTDPCGDWSQDADDTADNLPMPNFGCAVQHNIAAMVADPRDLVSPREMTPADAARRATIVKQYETGETTAAKKTADQSGAVSGIATSSGGGGQ